MYKSMQRAFFLFILVALVGCANSLPPLNFNVPNVGVSQEKLNAEVRSLVVSIARPDEQVGNVDYSLAETVGFGAGTGLGLTTAWEKAIQDSLDRMVIFRDDSSKKVSLNIKILQLDIPSIGISFTTKASARYEIIDRENGDIIYLSDINTEGTTPVNYAFLGATRARESVNRAVQNNILRFLQELETVDLATPMFPAGQEIPEPDSASDEKAEPVS